MQRRIKKHRRTHTRIMALIVLLLASAIFSVAIFYLNTKVIKTPTDNNNLSTKLKAGLFDAMYYVQPNEDFILATTQMLEENGFTVDSFFGEKVTAKLLLALPANYNMLILRLHSALADNGKLYFFSGELYSQYGYYYEQLSELVSKGNIPNGSSYFSVALDALSINKKELLNNSVFVAMGCDTIRDDFSLESLEKSADLVYVGWDSGVDLSRSDKSTQFFLEEFVKKGARLQEAVKATMMKVGPDPKYGSTLHYFPDHKGNFTIKDLVNKYTLSISEEIGSQSSSALKPKYASFIVVKEREQIRQYFLRRVLS